MRTYTLSIAAALVPLLGACGQNTPTIFERCEQTIRNYAVYRDDPAKAVEYANLFTENGSFTLGETTTQGQDALKSRHIAAHRNALWRHNMGEIRIGGLDFGSKGNDKLLSLIHI